MTHLHRPVLPQRFNLKFDIVTEFYFYINFFLHNDMSCGNVDGYVKSGRSVNMLVKSYLISNGLKRKSILCIQRGVLP